MTESEWLSCTDAICMLEFLRGKVSDRKLRLFACAFCRRIWHLLLDERSRQAVGESEKHADGVASDRVLREAEADAARASHENPARTFVQSWFAAIAAKMTAAKRIPWRALC